MNEKFHLERLVENAYLKAKENNLILLDKLGFQLTSNDIEKVGFFHPKESLIIRKDDADFCGARADTFVVMFGWSEYWGDEPIILIHANHKGNLHYSMFPY